MNPYLGYEIAAGVVLAYIVAVVLLYRGKYIGPDRALSLLGPALMIKTRKGRDALDRWGRFKRFWTAVGDLGIVLAIVSMGAIVVLLLFDAYAALHVAPSAAPSVQEAVGLPGINPFIPIGYGIVALVVGVVLHELSHGVVARSQGIGVKSLGILWCVVPVGAFVEQDDADMMAASRRKRDRVAAAGILANFAIAVVFFVALSVLVSTSVAPNANGVGITSVSAGSPAAELGLSPGDILLEVNGTAMTSVDAFESTLANTTPGENVSLAYYSASLGRTVAVPNVTLATSPTVAGRGFLGVAPAFLTPPALKQTLVWPLGSSEGPLTGAVDWLVLPLAGLEPLAGSSVQFFHLTGPLAAVNPTAFWISVNILYWVAWMSLLLGLSNALPLVPLDGGLLFRDFAASVAARFRKTWSEARLDQFGGQAAVASSLVILVLLVWQFVVPRLL
ncbi:MAG TPA: site-2 protease family protein [Thermoplasmata archaeon]|nr:site-2 protease family protein [Thermoplasmata archaeon]